jgi:hypothetical protein
MLLYYKPESVLPDESGPIPGETAKGYINLQPDMTVERPTERRLVLITPDRECVALQRLVSIFFFFSCVNLHL